MKKVVLLSLLFFSTLMVRAQLTVDNTTMTPEQLVQTLAGSGVQIFNVTFNGQPANFNDMQCGSFTASGTNLGISAGVLLASGDAQVAIGPNDQGLATLGNATIIIDDPDLNQISINFLNDVALLEFDFIPLGDTVSFRYVFASEEYNEYVCSDFNDVFGFFISGPGINGPFSNSGENIAIIPGSNTAVAINTVNLGVAGSYGNAANCEAIDPNWESYSIYYNNNTQNHVQYDGMTQVLTAFSRVQCGQTYHIKMAIADAGDNAFDSGVFLEAGSLSSNGMNISLETVTGEDVIYESCTPAQFVFSRPESTLSDTTIVNYELTGSAIEGTDYNFLPDTVIFLPGEDTVTMDLNAFQDGVLEGEETVVVIATYISDCGDTIVVTTNLTISEDPVFDALVPAPVVFCPTDSIPVFAAALGGTPPYVYTWSDATVNDSTLGSIDGLGTVTYYVDIVDFCGFTFNDSVIITQMPPPAIELAVSAQQATCIADSVLMTADASEGVQPLSISWSNGGTQAVVYGLTEGFPTYHVTVTDACGNTKEDSVTIEPAPDPVLFMIVPDVLVYCPTDSILLTATAGNGFPPYQYTWSTDEVNDSVFGSINGNGTVTYYVTATDFCGNLSAPDSAVVTQTDAPPIDIVLTAPLVTCIEDSVLMTALVTGGAEPLQGLSWSNGGTGSLVYGLTAGLPTYNLSVTDNCGNTAAESITLQAAPDPVLFMIVPDVLVYCPTDSILLTATAGNGFPPYQYTWSTDEVNDSIFGSINGNGTVTYYVTATDFCGNQVSDSVMVTLNQTLSIDSLNSTPSSNCLESGTTNSFVSGQTGTINYNWSGPGSGSPVIGNTAGLTDLATGWYYLVVTDNVCVDTDSIFVDILDPVSASFNHSSTIGPIPLNVDFFNSSQNADSFHWDFGNGTTNDVSDMSDQTAVYPNTTNYTVMLIAFQETCTDTAFVEFEIISGPSVFGPNIFTPNGDAINPYFTLAPENFTTFTYSIYNRWGNLVFEGDLSSPNWDGIANNGKEAEEAVYYYRYSGVGLNGNSKQGYGYFHLKKQ